MTRDELIDRTRQLIAEGERLDAAAVDGRAPDLAAAVGRPAVAAWGSMDRYHLAWLMVGKPKGIVRGRADDARRGGRLRPRGRRRQKTAALRMSLDAVERQRMPFVGETGGGLGSGEAPAARARRSGRRGRRDRAPDRAPDRSGLPADPTLADRLAEARREADAHRDHGERRAPRPDRMER